MPNATSFDGRVEVDDSISISFSTSTRIKVMQLVETISWRCTLADCSLESFRLNVVFDSLHEVGELVFLT